MTLEYQLYVGTLLDRGNPDAQHTQIYSPARDEKEARALLRIQEEELQKTKPVVIIQVSEVKIPGFRLEKVF